MDQSIEQSQSQLIAQHRSSIFLVAALTLFGLFVIIAASGLLYWGQAQLEEDAKTSAEKTLESSNTFFDEAKLRGVTLAKGLCEDVAGINRTAALGRHDQYAALWPYIQIVLFDRDNKIISSSKRDSITDMDALRRSNFEEHIATAPDILALQAKLAAAHEVGQSYVQVEGKPYYAAVAAPASGAVGQVVVLIPLDATLLNQAKNLVQADFALLSTPQAVSLGKVDATKYVLLTVSGDMLSFFSATEVISSVPEQPFKKGLYQVAIQSLNNTEGNPIAWMLIVPAKEEMNAVLLGAGACAILFGLVLLFIAYKVKTDAQAFQQSFFMFKRGRSFIRKQREQESTEKFSEAAQAILQQMMNSIGQEGNSFGNIDQRRFFDNAPIGFFRCTDDGRLLQVNQTFAAMLGYDSAVQMLSHGDMIQNLCSVEGAGRALLADLKERPTVRHSITLTLQAGGQRSFWIVSIANYAVDRPTIEGFLLDRTLEERLLVSEEQCSQVLEVNGSLALLLASVCKQSQQYYFASSRSQISPAPATPACEAETNICLQKDERRHGAVSLQAMLEDIYEIGLLASEGHMAMAATKFELAALLRQVAVQAKPTLDTNGITFDYAVSDELDGAFIGCVPVLRHALLRLLLFIIQNRQAGKSHISVFENKDTEAPYGAIRLIFTVAWELEATENEAGEDGITQLPTQQEDSNALASDVLPLHDKEEVKILQYLAHRLHGQVREGINSIHSASMSLCIQIGRTIEGEDLMTSAGNAKDIAGEQLSFADSLESRAEYSPQGMEGPESLNLLVMDDDILNDKSKLETVVSHQEPLDILLVEDSLNSRLLFSLYLRDTPHRITEAADGQEGVELFREKRFDIVFMDMEMPRLDGYQATRIMRAFEQEQGATPIPIVAQTAYVLPEFKNKCMVSGCSEFLPKPFSKHRLLRMLATVEKRPS